MSKISMRRALSRLPKDTLTVHRDAGGSRVNGFWKEGGRTGGEEFRAVVHPSTARELKNLPGGDHAAGKITLYTKKLLKTVEQAEGKKADQVRWDGRLYEIIHDLNWRSFGYGAYVAQEVRAR